MKYSIIIPVYKEHESLPFLLNELSMLSCFPDIELIVVDDTEDNSTEMVLGEFIKSPSFVYIGRRKRLGLASAVIEGFKCASGDVLICMDGDGSHPSDCIARLIAELAGGASMALGSRYILEGGLDENWGLVRRIVSKMACYSTLFITDVRDPMSGCFAIKREVFLSVLPTLKVKGYKIGLELIIKSNLDFVAEVPLKFRARKFGKSKLTLTIIYEFIVQLFKLYNYRILLKN